MSDVVTTFGPTIRDIWSVLSLAAFWVWTSLLILALAAELHLPFGFWNQIRITRPRRLNIDWILIIPDGLTQEFEDDSVKHYSGIIVFEFILAIFVLFTFWQTDYEHFLSRPKVVAGLAPRVLLHRENTRDKSRGYLNAYHQFRSRH